MNTNILNTHLCKDYCEVKFCIHSEYWKIRTRKILYEKLFNKVKMFCWAVLPEEQRNFFNWRNCIILFLSPHQICYNTSMVSSFYIPFKHQNISGFLTFSRGIEMEHWHKMNERLKRYLLKLISRDWNKI